MTKEKILEEFFVKTTNPGCEPDVFNINGSWYAPKFGCDTLGMLLDSLEKEICICAAVIAENGIIVRGQRHGDCLYALSRMKLKQKSDVNAQGFITSTGRYVNREEGRKLQDKAEITSADKERYRYDTLFSEDLY